MKVPTIYLAILVAIAAFSMVPSAKANPNASQPAKSQPVQSAKNDPSRVPSTMTNYWDAKQWDKKGGASFWHETEGAGDQSRQTADNTGRPKKEGFLKKFVKG